jgi:dTDP-4-amino-4,6-dideoxygalactose transaminase
MDPIMSLAETHGFKVIEDCAQAHGARYKGRSVGSIGHIGAWSFCQDKIMTTGGEGGMVTTDDTDLWSAMWSFKDHGKSYDAVYNRDHPAGFRWVHESFGTNWRMLEMQAVIGRIQLRKLEGWTERRRTIASEIVHPLTQFTQAVRVPAPAEGVTHAHYRQYAYIRPDGLKAGWSRDRIIAACAARGLRIMQGSCSEIYLEKAFDSTPWRPASRLPIARELGETSLMFLCHPTMTDEEVQHGCAVLGEVFSEASN